MKPNLGTLDHLIRLFAGLPILAPGYAAKTWWGWLGFIPLLTALFRFCPAYLPLGLNSCGTKRKPGA